MIAQNYPRLLDGLLPGGELPRQLGPRLPGLPAAQRYFGTPSGAALTDAQRIAITGLANPNGCPALGAGADVVNASEGCDESGRRRGADLRPGHQPRRGALHGLGQHGQRLRPRPRTPATRAGPSTTSASSTGSRRSRTARSPSTEFLDLNEGIGGFDDNGDLRGLSARWRTDALWRSPTAPAHQPGSRRLPGRADHRHPQLHGRRGQRPPVLQHLPDARPPRPLQRRPRQPGHVPGQGRRQRQPRCRTRRSTRWAPGSTHRRRRPRACRGARR